MARGDCDALSAVPALGTAFFDREVTVVARDLLGMLLGVEETGGVIVETEAYDGDDPASHSFRGRTARNGSMFRGPGHAYVYRSYGIHWCFNVTCRAGSAVLVRALDPVDGVALMRERRGSFGDRGLCSGPGRLCQALGITGELDGVRLDGVPFGLERRMVPERIAVGPRIGISKGVETAWRFCVPGAVSLSRAAGAVLEPRGG